MNVVELRAKQITYREGGVTILTTDDQTVEIEGAYSMESRRVEHGVYSINRPTPTYQNETVMYWDVYTEISTSDTLYDIVQMVMNPDWYGAK